MHGVGDGTMEQHWLPSLRSASYRRQSINRDNEKKNDFQNKDELIL